MRKSVLTRTDVAAHTPADRDRFLDVIRLGSLLVVIVGHCLMLTVSVSGSTVRFGNALTDFPLLQALTWVLQVLPLFFFAGVAAGTLGWHDDTRWGTWVFRRTQRLMRPLGVYLIAAFVLVEAAVAVLGTAWRRPLAVTSVQLLWFLGMYLLVLVAVPPLIRWVRSGLRVWATIAVLVGVVAAVDAARLTGAPAELGYVNVVAWLIPGVLGIAYVRGLLTRSAAVAVAVVVAAIDVALVAFGPYEVALVTVPGQRLSNMAPPSLLLAGHAIVLCCLAVAVAPWVRAFARRPRVWFAVVVGNTGAMTLYLWHMPALLTVLVVAHLLDGDRSGPAQSGFWTLTVAQLVAVGVLTLVLFTRLRVVENTPVRGWDAPAQASSRARSGVAVVGVAVAAAALFGATRNGLVDGFAWLVVFVGALGVARWATWVD
ncbi:acyltransferase family protein [Nocardia camponoti]|uniref:Acyltransferase n=1 Tax=Nocardia camponoti TaxID=1616106 RepID=A0A917V4V0_9NOCA|nr:acyltransferase [Nocardia camponoti]GGK37642.1 acyltransferase [Nocardia camponoti]